MRTGRPELLLEVPPDLVTSLWPAGRAEDGIDLEVRSCLTVPIRSETRIFGTIFMWLSQTTRRYGPSEMLMALKLGRLIAHQIEQQQRNEQARDERMERDDFIATTAHELRGRMSTLPA